MMPGLLLSTGMPLVIVPTRVCMTLFVAAIFSCKKRIRGLSITISSNKRMLLVALDAFSTASINSLSSDFRTSVFAFLSSCDKSARTAANLSCSFLTSGVSSFSFTTSSSVIGRSLSSIDTCCCSSSSCSSETKLSSALKPERALINPEPVSATVDATAVEASTTVSATTVEASTTVSATAVEASTTLPTTEEIDKEVDRLSEGPHAANLAALSLSLSLSHGNIASNAAFFCSGDIASNASALSFAASAARRATS